MLDCFSLITSQIFSGRLEADCLVLQIYTKMANWAELPRDLLISIAQHLKSMEHYVAFGAVSSSWRKVATKENFKGVPLWQQIPSLMLAAEKDDDYREFYSLLEDEVVAKIFLPETKGKKCMEAGFGWLFTIGQEGETSLVNPFTRDQIDLPHQKTTEDFENQETLYPQIFYQKAVLSSSPCQNPSDFVLMVIDGGSKFLSFWRPGDKLWTRISTPFASFFDVVHHRGQFYAISGGSVVVCDITGKEGRMVAQLSASFPYSHMYYIVESSGTLLVVLRNGVQVMPIEKRPDGYIIYDSDSESGSKLLTYGTNQFRVLEFDAIHNKWTQIQDLGDRALFLGHSVSVCIDQASRFPGIKANRIYFTDDFFESYLSAENGGGRDMGVYNLEDGSITPHFKGQSLSLIGPPIWVIPCSSCMSNYRP